MNTTEPFDAKRAMLAGPDQFQRLRISKQNCASLAAADLSGDEDLIIAARNGSAIAFQVRSMAYHHLAQGELGGEPFIVSFCGICHSAMGFTPTIDGKVHHFSAGGLYNGVVLLIDDETRTYWNHITGEGLKGPLAGTQLEAWPAEMTNVRAALRKYPKIQLSRTSTSLIGKLMGRWQARSLRSRGFFPPMFRRTMGKPDDRLPPHTHGLGVMVRTGTKTEARFYPMKSIGDGSGTEDPWGERVLRVRIGDDDSVPFAEWSDGERPLQLFSRWYGFSYTYPGCAIAT